MKKEQYGLLCVVAGIHMDICRYQPTFAKCLELTYNQLEVIIESRGCNIFFLDLPEFGKIFDKGLSDGYLQPEVSYRWLGRLSSGRVRLWSDLFHEVFDDNGDLISDADPNLVFFLRHLFAFAKKVKKECSNEATSATLEEFVDIENRFQHHYDFNRDGECLDSFPDPETDISATDFLSPKGGIFTPPEGEPEHASFRSRREMLHTFQKVCDRFSADLGPIKFGEIRPRHGTGAVADQAFGNDKYHFPTWPDKLSNIFPADQFAFANWNTVEDIGLENIEVPAKLMAVPKTLKGPRLIAAEPVCNQYIQQGLLRELRKKQPRWSKKSINFIDQRPSQELAREGSVTGEYATVDLKSASDYLSCALVARVLRRNPDLWHALLACRSEFVVLPGGSLLRMQKFSHQGSAVTFPIQSFCYYLIALAVGHVVEGRRISRKSLTSLSGKIRVFGDDIIVPTTWVEDLSVLLDLCGLVVNWKKTHYNGHFRESCGGDFYKGHKVNPIYVTYFSSAEWEKDPGMVSSIIEVSNNLHEGGLWATAEAVHRLLPDRFRDIPACNEPLGCLHLRSFSNGVSFHQKHVRWHQDHQTWTIRAWVILLNEKTQPRQTYQSLLQWFTESPEPDSKWKSGYLTGRPVSKYRRKRVPVPMAQVENIP